MPMQVLQFDNTPFDLFVRGQSQESIGTPNLCASIDVYTRMITGFELTLNPINRQSILETLVQSILPKDRYLENIFPNNDYRPEWNINGYPVLILVDNGMDYRSNDVKRFCMEFDIILEFAPLSTPRFKAYIESWFNTLKEGIKHELQGEGFRPKLIERLMNPDLEPEENVIFTNQQSERWLTSWILDDYHLTNPYKDGLKAPKLIYRDFIEKNNPIILPQPRDPPRNGTEYNELIINGLVCTQRVLKNNIEFMNLKYSSPDLVKLFKKLGKIKVTVLYDVRDIRSIWIINPISHKPLSLQLTNGWANAFIRSYEDMPVSLSFWKTEVSAIKNANRNKLSLSIFRKERGSKYRAKLRSEAKDLSKRANKKNAAIEENKRKLQRKPVFSDRFENPKSIVQVKENGEFVRKYVPLPKSLQSKKRSTENKTNKS